MLTDQRLILGRSTVTPEMCVSRLSKATKLYLNFILWLSIFKRSLGIIYFLVFASLCLQLTNLHKEIMTFTGNNHPVQVIYTLTVRSLTYSL